MKKTGSFLSEIAIYNMLQILQKPKGLLYDPDKDERLIQKSQKHVARYGKPINSKNIIFLTHPFYSYLETHERSTILQNELQTDQVREYNDNLFELFQDENIRKKANIILFESLDHYTGTKNLLENGFVDSVIFSKSDTGFLFNKTDLDNFKDRNFFVGGSYAGICLSQAIDEIYARVDSKDQIWCLKDICLNSPWRHEELKIEKIIPEFNSKHTIPSQRTITVGELADKLN